MKKLNRKGFTIVELVIVIAVIAILAAVLIPTFGTVIQKAKDSSALQKAQNALQIVAAEEAQNYDGTYYYVVDDDHSFVYDTTGDDGLQPTSSTAGSQILTTNSDLIKIDVDVYKVVSGD